MESKILNKREINANATQTTIQLYKTDRSNITIDEVSAIATKFSTGGSKVMIRGLNIERMSTLKAFDQPFEAESFVEYYKNSVAESDLGKFTTFKLLQITVFKPNNKKN